MFNVQNPDVDDAPRLAQAFKTAVIAATFVVSMLVTVVISMEYRVDPTGTGREFVEELVFERESSQEDGGHRVAGSVPGLFVSTGYAQKTADSWDEEVHFTLIPGESIKYKLVVNEGAEIDFLWAARGESSTTICTVMAAAKPPDTAWVAGFPLKKAR